MTPPPVPTKPPKVFISYSWTSPEHVEWVKNLATLLRSDGGVDVVLDDWHLKEGQNRFAFMEQMVNDPEVKKVLCVCDKMYAEKANAGKGGVGTETQIISPEVYRSAKQEKFIALVREWEEVDGVRKECVPTFFNSRWHFDFSDDDEFSKSYSKLLRNIWGRPESKAPDIGTPPAHLFQDEAPPLKTAGQFLRLKNAAEKGAKNVPVYLREFLNTFANSMALLRIDGSTPKAAKPHELVIDRVKAFRPYRDQFVDFSFLFASYLDEPAHRDELHGFLEKVLVYRDKPQDMNSWSEWYFDHYKFITCDMFLHLFAVMLQERKYALAGKLVGEPYQYDSGRRDGVITEDYAAFNGYGDTFHDGGRGDKGAVSVGELLHNQATHPRVPFRDLFQADVLLWLYPWLSAVASKNKYSNWYPRTLGFSRTMGPLPVFARATTQRGLAPFTGLFGIKTHQELVGRMNSMLSSPEFGEAVKHSNRFIAFGLKELFNLEEILHAAR
jgi:hypothetical protein